MFAPYAPAASQSRLFGFFFWPEQKHVYLSDLMFSFVTSARFYQAFFVFTGICQTLAYQLLHYNGAGGIAAVKFDPTYSR